MLALVAAAVIVVVGGVNMEPRLKERSRVEFDSAAYQTRAPQVGDIVLIQPPVGAEENRCASPATGLCERSAGGPAPDVRYITRIVAVGRDTVRMRRGRIIRNGRLETRRTVRRCRRSAPGCTFPNTITVPPGHVYLAGDNRASSDDSRFWGALPVAQLLGRYVRTLK